MDGAGVAVVLHPEGAHGFEDFGEEGCGRVCVQVDSAHGFILLRYCAAMPRAGEHTPGAKAPLIFGGA